MTTENAIAELEGIQLVPTCHSVETFNENARSTNFPPRFQLCSYNTHVVQDDKVKAGHFALVDNEEVIADFGPETNVMNYGFRYKALDMRDRNAVKAYYDPFSPDFKVIKDIALSGEKDCGCLSGVEFLVYCPDSKVTKWATFYFASKTLKRVAKNFERLVGKLVNLKSKPIKQDPFRWHGAIVAPSTLTVQLPSREEILKETKRFQEETVAITTETADDPEVGVATERAQ